MSYYVSEDLSMKLKGNWDSETMELLNLYLKCVENYIWDAKNCFAGGFRNTNQVIKWSWAGNHGMIDLIDEFSRLIRPENAEKYPLGTAKYPLTAEKWHTLVTAMRTHYLSFLVKGSISGEENTKWESLIEYGSNGSYLTHYEWDNEKVWDMDSLQIDFSRSDHYHIVIADGVTSIGEGAFAMYGWEKTSLLKSVEIPNSVTSIEKNAFYQCKSLQRINIPDSVTSIGKSAFERCEKLASVTIPDSVKSIGPAAFLYCHKLADNAGFVIIKNVLYSYCGRGRNVVVPNGVTAISDYAFSFWDSCNTVKSIVIPSSVTSIGDHAFSHCKNLTSVTIPTSVTHIGVGAFSECRSLSDIVIPDGVTSIGALAFSECSALTSIAIPEGVTHIGNRTFANCTALKRITLPNSVKKIYTSADEPEGRKWFVVFQGCDSVEVIVAPRYPLSEVDSKKKRALAVGFAIAVERGYDIPDERREEYLKYIKGQKKKLYPIAVKELALLRLMLSEKMIPAADLATVTELAQQEGSTEALELLAAY